MSDAEEIFTAAQDPDTGEAFCTCGASAKKGEAKRFLQRHPSMCSARRLFNRRLAQGVRCVEDRRTNEEETMNEERKPIRRGFVE